MTTIPTTSPIAIPIKRSVKTIPATVTAKGANCFHPSLNMVKNNFGFAKLYPTRSKIDANTDNGILFKSVGIKRIEINNNKP